MNQLKKEILAQVERSEKDGHTFAIQAELIDRCSKRAKNPPREIVHRELSELIREKKLVQEGNRIYLPRTKEYEDLAAAALAKILSAAPLPPVQIPEKLTIGDITLTNEQRNAVAFALNHRISLILGGAGRGKSTMIQALVHSFPKEEGSVLICSPTGKAVDNLRERTNIQSATTIHASFWRVIEDKQKIFDKLVIADEISMVSLEMLAWILTSIQPDCRLVFVGDEKQLPSVGCGNVVNDLLKLKVPSFRLKTCHRQSDHESALARNLANFDRCRKMGDFSFDTQQAITAYNALVRGVHNYYQMATDITEDCQEIHNATYKMLYNRLKPKRGALNPKTADYKRYGGCTRIFKVQDMTILPVHYCSHRQTLGKKKAVNLYTPEGRAFRHKELSFSNAYMLKELAAFPVSGKSIEYNDNRVSRFSAQQGKCGVTGQMFLDISEVHCHHKKPTHQGGKDNYGNLILVLPEVHRLIHAKMESTINGYLEVLMLNEKQLEKVNELRKMAGLEPIKASK